MFAISNQLNVYLYISLTAHEMFVVTFVNILLGAATESNQNIFASGRQSRKGIHESSSEKPRDYILRGVQVSY
jgi:hypothetical protein